MEEREATCRRRSGDRGDRLCLMNRYQDEWRLTQEGLKEERTIEEEEKTPLEKKKKTKEGYDLVLFLVLGIRM